MASAESIIRSCDDVIHFAEKLRRDARELDRRSREDLRGSFVTPGLTGGGQTSVKDDQDVPMPPLNDPTGEAAVGGDRPDPVRQAVLEVLDELKVAHKAMRDAWQARNRAMPAAPADGSNVVHLDEYRRGQAVCANPWCEDLSDRGCAGRDKACHEYLRRTGRDAGPAVIAERVRQREVRLEKLRDRVVDARDRTAA